MGMGNNFTDEQLRYFYKDEPFISFLSDYFTSFDVNNISTDIDLTNNGIENINIYARILLANVDYFFEMIEKLENIFTFTHKKVNHTCKGEIRGSLLINQYAKEIVSHHYPKRYECVQKKKSYCTPENVLICFSILKILENMEQFLYSINRSSSIIKKNYINSPEYNKIIICMGRCEDYLTSKELSECRQEALKYINLYGSQLPNELIDIIASRIREERISNIVLYEKIIDWIKWFLKHGIAFITTNTIDILRYDDSFADKLFELWTLYSLKAYISTETKFNCINYYKFTRRDGVIYECKTDSDVIEFIYQVGKNVYWDDKNPVSWNYIKPSNSILIGKPDITIRVHGSKDRIIMFDAKNRIRENGQVSEEVYKMIGYFDNFKKMLESKKYSGTPKLCILLFRGDTLPFVKELKKGNSDYTIQVVSVSPSFEESLNSNQFNYIKDTILKIL